MSKYLRSTKGLEMISTYFEIISTFFKPKLFITI